MGCLEVESIRALEVVDRCDAVMIDWISGTGLHRHDYVCMCLRDVWTILTAEQDEQDLLGGL